MAYCTVTDVTDMIKGDMVNYIIDNNYIEDEEERRNQLIPLAEQAIDDADAEIDGYLAGRYNVPFSPVPKVIEKFAKDIALYNLVSRKGIDETDREKTYLNRYNAAIKFLTSVAEGKIDIGISNNTLEDAARNGFEVRSSERLFSRESMRGW